MIKSKVFRWLAVLVAVATGLTIAAAAASVGPFRDRPHVVPQPQTGPQQPPPLSETNPAAAEDQAKPVYQGPLGDFLVGRNQGSDRPPCPRPLRPAQNYRSSDLYSPLFGDLEGFVAECGDGKIIVIEGVYGGAIVGKSYFVGSPIVPYEAPFDRLVLLTVAGKPAIAQRPIPGFSGTLRLAAIERFPSGDLPGILVSVDNTRLSLEQAAALAAQLMGERP